MSISSHRSLVSPPRGFSGMDKHRGLGQGGLPSMGPPCRPHQRLKVVLGGVLPPSALGDGHTDRQSRQGKGNPILGITESLGSNP